MLDRDKIKLLFERYQKGKCTPEEQARLHRWFNHYAKNESHGLDDLELSSDSQQENIAKKQRSSLSKITRLWPYAAAMLMVCAVFSYLYFNSLNRTHRMSQVKSVPENDVMPGGNKAMLTLADGTTINLNSEQDGIVISADKISYSNGSQKLAELDDGEVNHLVLSTPNGGTYQLTLSDGTKVWLNAGSTLRYPSRFAKNERVVELQGEGYFAVVKDKSRPFRVKSQGQKVEVLGTEFNISAYHDDLETKTTLVSGAVKLQANESNNQLSLEPGEQASLTGKGSLKKQLVDVEPFVAWKKGEFYFDNIALTDMLKQLARWYDMKVVFEGKIPNERFSGSMSRDVSLQTVLKMLKISEISYRIEKDKLIIE